MNGKTEWNIYRMSNLQRKIDQSYIAETHKILIYWNQIPLVDSFGFRVT